jgi:hypothetical protein
MREPKRIRCNEAADGGSQLWRIGRQGFELVTEKQTQLFIYKKGGALGLEQLCAKGIYIGKKEEQGTCKRSAAVPSNAICCACDCFLVNSAITLNAQIIDSHICQPKTHTPALCMRPQQLRYITTQRRSTELRLEVLTHNRHELALQDVVHTDQHFFELSAQQIELVAIKLAAAARGVRAVLEQRLSHAHGTRHTAHGTIRSEGGKRSKLFCNQ